MTWQELTKIALLGTEHSSIPEEVLKDLRARGMDVEKEAPVVLAEAAAMFAQMRKAGFRLEDFDGKLPEPAEPDDEKYCSHRSARHLHLILSGEYEAVLPEFLRHADKCGRYLPPEHLPELMNRHDVTALWPAIEPLLGGRGRWLLAQHPDWGKRLAPAAGFDWYTGEREERLALLRHLRETAPEQALELLRTTWDEEDYRRKAAFLEALGTGLSMSDEPFLEACLGEGRKEVRQAAAELLVRLPESGLAGRMYRRAAACFVFKKNALHVSIPGEMDGEAARDGILKIHPGWPGGRKAGYLGQVVSVVPPGRWESFFDKKPTVILKILNRTDWAKTLLKAVVQATILQNDERWVEALLGWYTKFPDLPLWQQPEMAQLAGIAPATVLNDMALKIVKTAPLPEALPRILPFFMDAKNDMTDELTLLLIHRFREWLTSNDRRIWDPPPFKEMLQVTGLHCRPGLYDTLQKDWDKRVPLWEFYEKHVEKMLNTLQFRREMVEAMKNQMPKI
ncbi:MAG: DUF5691 domain-containing protein [Saprospiraceae bacterium]